MKNCIRPIVAAAALFILSTPAFADCYADYKAKRDNPLRLHYGVISLPNAVCNNPEQATQEVANRIAQEGWKLLNVIKTFGENGLDKRKDSAGRFFLRF